MHQCVCESVSVCDPGEVRFTCVCVSGRFLLKGNSEIPFRYSVNSVSLYFTLSPSLSLAPALQKRDEGMIGRRLQLRPPINTALLCGMRLQDYTENHKQQMTLSNYFLDFEHSSLTKAWKIGTREPVCPALDAVHAVSFLLIPLHFRSL